MPSRSIVTIMTLSGTNRLLLAPGLLTALISGCYDPELLVDRVRNKAIRTRLDEVPLGDYRVTLPQDSQTGEMTEIDVRIFALAKRYRINEIEDEMQEKAPQIEDSVIRTLRELTREELAEPELTKLRERLMSTLNTMITAAPLEFIGFYDVRFIRH